MPVTTSSLRQRIAAGYAGLKEVLRNRGLFYFRRARVVSCDLDGIKPAAGETPFVVGEATAEERLSLVAAEEGDPSEWSARTQRGDRCLVARSGLTCLGSLWIARSAEVMTEVNLILDVTRDPTAAYLFDGYVLAPYRKKGVLRSLLLAAKGWAVHQGITRLYAAFARENRASEHALRTMGFVTLVGDVGMLRILGRDRMWVRLARGGAPPGVLTPRGPDGHPRRREDSGPSDASGPGRGR